MKKEKLLIIIFINFIILGLTSAIFDIKYEQVDDFIIYNLYSGLDGTYNLHGIYIHPIICFVISIFYRIIPIINWHTIFLISMQFICFTIMGYIFLKKHDNGKAVIIYTVFASVFFTSLLMMIQYTSVAALLMLTSFVILLNVIENIKETKSKKEIIGIFILFSIGFMTRMQSVLIIIPFMIIYFIIYLLKRDRNKIFELIKYYLIYVFIAILIYMSNYFIYNNDKVYKNYMEYNDIRATLNDIIKVDYYEDKEIFDEIGWSANDWNLFCNFNFGDENIYTKENLQKILDYKIKKDGIHNFNFNIDENLANLESQIINENTYISIIFFAIFIMSLFTKKKTKENVAVFLTTIGINLLFIAIGRSMVRVVIPEYISGTVLIMNNLYLGEKSKINDEVRNSVILTILILLICHFAGNIYKFNYRLEDYSNYKELINYTNSNKDNVYLSTIPAIQFRYLAYNVYEMPPKGAFSNLRTIGGWDTFTKNYYDFKNRYNLEGNFLDLLKDNVYLIDGEVLWSNILYSNYRENIFLSIKENYGIEVECNEIMKFNNLSIYKVNQK